MHTISVIIPVYKVEPYLSRCVDSILNQTFRDFELILVDDGSPDRCGAMCDEYAEKDSRIFVIHKENGGLSDARNAGIDWAFQNSDSQWLTFIDSDDWVHPRYLQTLFEAVQSGDVEISVCNPLFVHSEDEITETEAFPGWTVMDVNTAFDKAHLVSAWGKLYPKECFKELRFPFGKLYEDAFITYKILYVQEKLAVCDQALYFYFCGSQSITRSKWDPRHLDELEACEQILKYCRTHKLQYLYRKNLSYYVGCIIRQILLIKDEPEHRKYYKQLVRKLKRTLILYRWYCSRKIAVNKGIYATAFPTVTKIGVKGKRIIFRK